jgi:hypothetical protein
LRRAAGGRLVAVAGPVRAAPFGAALRAEARRGSGVAPGGLLRSPDLQGVLVGLIISHGQVAGK